MLDVRLTDTFFSWLENLRDRTGRSKLLVRIDRVRLGLFGDTKSVGHGVYELRINFGPGYRIYYARLGKDIVFLLAGGDKSSQKNDIKKAQGLALRLKENS